MKSVNEAPSKPLGPEAEGAGTSPHQIARGRLHSLLTAYEAAYPEELHAKAVMLEALTRQKTCFERTCLPGHFTASAWVMNFRADAVALVQHRKLHRWLQPGGHADGNPLLLAVALKEVQEEIGISTVAVLPGIFDIDVHDIPARGETPLHQHLDVRYAFRVTDDSPLRCSEESLQVEWVPLADLSNFSNETSLHRMRSKWEHRRFEADDR